MDFFTPEMVPFTAAIGITIALAILEFGGLMMGLHPSAAIDSSLPDLDVDVDVDAPEIELAPLSQFLSWISFGRLPALVVLILFLTSFGLLGLFGQQSLRNVFGFALQPWIASVPAAIGALYTTHFIGHGLARIMPREESDAVSTSAFIGRVATIFRGSASAGHPAEAKLTDIHGHTHYVLVEPDDHEQTLPTGSEVVIVRQKGSIYRAITRLKPAD
ncbi:MAG: YqiJ family protein [Devosia sp.]|uniref:YqiJ family protein n=1 Tax=Devosia sp. TaxID=1871048 RepID=UPI0024CDD46F|nr:YqiJ family protein [Devosia sp.]UYN99883.1 MAG: YqiJ family protein [Devosia sp.]